MRNPPQDSLRGPDGAAGGDGAHEYTFARPITADAAAPGDSYEIPPLARNHAFRILWIGQSLAMLCEAMASVSVILFVLHSTGSVVQMGAVSATASISHLLALVLGGGLADRHRLRLMIFCDIVRALLYGSLVAVVATHQPIVPIIYVVMALTSATSTWFNVAFQTAVKDMVRPSDLLAANARMQGVGGLVSAIGPVLGGIVCGVIGHAGAFGLMTASFFLSGVSLLLIRRRPSSFRESPAPAGFAMSSLPRGFRYIVRDPLLRVTVPLTWLLVVITAGGQELVIYQLKHGLGFTDVAVGVTLGGSCVGIVIAALVTPRLHRRFGLVLTALVTLALEGASLVAVSWVVHLVSCIAVGMGFLFGERVRMIVVGSAEQERVPHETLGSVVAAKWLFSGLVAPLAVGFGAGAAGRWGAPTVLGVSGWIMIVLAAVLLVCWLLRRRSGERAQIPWS